MCQGCFKDFVFNFIGLNSKVGVLEIPISPEVISAVREEEGSDQGSGTRSVY